jgi:hypothetical protein
MKTSTAVGCSALLVALTSVVKGYGPTVFVFIAWDACCALWRASCLLSQWIVPHWLNRFAFSALYYIGMAVIWTLKSVLQLWEDAFDAGMLRLGHRPSAASISISDSVAAHLESAGVSSLARILYRQFFLVPDDLQKFCSSDNTLNFALLAIIICTHTGEKLWREMPLSRVVRDGRFWRRCLLFFVRIFSFDQTQHEDLCVTLVFIFLLLDVLVFAITLSTTIFPLLCIFAALALMSFVIHYFCPSIRPKHSAPSMALLAATYAYNVFNQPHHPCRNPSTMIRKLML